MGILEISAPCRMHLALRRRTSESFPEVKCLNNESVGTALMITSDIERFENELPLVYR